MNVTYNRSSMNVQLNEILQKTGWALRAQNDDKEMWSFSLNTFFDPIIRELE